MEILFTISSTVVEQLQKPTLSFLIGGTLLAALGSRFDVPQQI